MGWGALSSGGVRSSGGVGVFRVASSPVLVSEEQVLHPECVTRCHHFTPARVCLGSPAPPWVLLRAGQNHSSLHLFAMVWMEGGTFLASWLGAVLAKQLGSSGLHLERSLAKGRQHLCLNDLYRVKAVVKPQLQHKPEACDETTGLPLAKTSCFQTLQSLLFSVGVLVTL